MQQMYEVTAILITKISVRVVNKMNGRMITIAQLILKIGMYGTIYSPVPLGQLNSNFISLLVKKEKLQERSG